MTNLYRTDQIGSLIRPPSLLDARDAYKAGGITLEALRGAEDAAILANPQECLAFCKELPELAAFAPAIGTAHGFYSGEPKIAYELLRYITERVDIPIALHGGTGLTEEQFHRCIALGCAKVNISTMHKKQFIEGFLSVRANNPKASEPIPFINGQYEAMKSDVLDMIRTFGSAGKSASLSAA